MSNHQVDFESLAGKLLASSRILLESWFPNGRWAGHEFKVGSLNCEAGDSLSINANTYRRFALVDVKTVEVD